MRRTTAICLVVLAALFVASASARRVAGCSVGGGQPYRIGNWAEARASAVCPSGTTAYLRLVMQEKHRSNGQWYVASSTGWAVGRVALQFTSARCLVSWGTPASRRWYRDWVEYEFKNRADTQLGTYNDVVELECTR